MGNMSVTRQAITESAANTLTEQTLRLPTDPSTKTVAKIFGVRLEPDLPNPAIPSGGVITDGLNALVLSLRQGEATIPQISTPGVIARAETRQSILQDTDGGGLAMPTVGSTWSFLPFGLVIASSVLSLYIQGVSSQSARTGHMMMWYVLERVTLEEFVGALSLLENLG